MKKVSLAFVLMLLVSTVSMFAEVDRKVLGTKDSGSYEELYFDVDPLQMKADLMSELNDKGIKYRYDELKRKSSVMVLFPWVATSKYKVSHQHLSFKKKTIDTWVFKYNIGNRPYICTIDYTTKN